MKKNFVYLIAFFLVLIITSCEKEVKITGGPSPVISIDDVKLLHKGAAVILTKELLAGAENISGIVISDPANGNAPDGMLVVQSYRRKTLRGIAVNLGADANNFKPGDSVIVGIVGGKLERVDGVTQISGVTSDKVSKISENNDQKINVAVSTFGDLVAGMKNYENTLITLKTAVGDGLVANQTFAGDITLSDWANTFVLSTKINASFASEEVPPMGDYTGIAYYKAVDQPVLLMRSSDDYTGYVLEPYNPGQSYLNFPEGFEPLTGFTTVRKTGYTTPSTIGYEKHPSGEWVMNRMYSLTSVGIVNKTGDFALMMQSAQEAYVVMNWNLPYGASSVSFSYGAATTTDTKLPIILTVEYSQDSGGTWTELSEKLRIENTATKYTFQRDLDIRGAFRIRIKKDNSAARSFIDQIDIKQN